MRRLTVIYLLLLSLLLSACRGSHGKNDRTATSLDTLYHPQYASGFEIFRSGKSSVLHITNPWQGADSVSQWIFLARDGEQAPADFDGVTLQAPIRKAVCMSSSYVAFLEALGADSVIRAISGTGFIFSERIRQRIAAGEITETGFDNSLNFEQLVALQPDVIFLYGITGENALTAKLNELGLKTIYIGDYVENNPLGRAEWVTLFGEFVDRGERARTLFDSIRTEYNQAKALVANVEQRPEVMLNAPWQDSWFVPGDRSYMVRLIEDAGGNYACRGVDSDQSRPISTETAFVTASKADYWLSPGTATNLAELRAMNTRFESIKPVREKHVYNNNARTTPSGGSDFWESGALYPDRTLKDMIHILHPELLPDHTLFYFRQLK